VQLNSFAIELDVGVGHLGHEIVSMSMLEAVTGGYLCDAAGMQEIKKTCMLQVTT
jgi:hypothetical protein